MAATLLDVETVRARFGSLRDGGFVFLDAPGGSQVPDEVGDAIASALREASANIGATYETSKRVEQILAIARDDAARFFACSPDDVIFGTNMTWLDFALSRTAARDWNEGDRILVSRLDHDGGVAPWVELAADRGFEVEWVDVTEDLRLDYDDLANRLDERVRVVACVGSSNAIGTIVDVARVSDLAHEAGALCWVDAVQYAAHVPTDVQALGCDVFIASAYKFCGPHLGVAYGRHDLLESWRPYKARPAASEPVGRRFEVGTAPYELLAGFSATLAYLDSIGGMEAIAAYERELGQRFLDGLPDGATVYGLQTMDGRVPTFLINLEGVDAVEDFLGQRHVGSGGVVAHVTAAPTAGDRSRHARLGENPRDRDLRDRRVQTLCDGSQPVGHREALLAVARPEKPLVEARLEPRAGPQRTNLLERPAREDPASERLVNRDRDPQLAPRRDRRAVVEVVDQAQPDLDRVDRALRVTTQDLLRRVVRDADRADEPGVHELCHRAPGLLERDARLVGPVEEVHVDVTPSEAFQARAAGRVDLLAAEAAA